MAAATPTSHSWAGRALLAVEGRCRIQRKARRAHARAAVVGRRGAAAVASAREAHCIHGVGVLVRSTRHAAGAARDGLDQAHCARRARPAVCAGETHRARAAPDAVAAGGSQHPRVIWTRQARHCRSRRILQSIEAVLGVPAPAVRARCLVRERLEGACRAHCDCACGPVAEVARVAHTCRGSCAPVTCSRDARGAGMRGALVASCCCWGGLKCAWRTQHTRSTPVASLRTARGACGAFLN